MNSKLRICTLIQTDVGAIGTSLPIVLIGCNDWQAQHFSTLIGSPGP